MRETGKNYTASHYFPGEKLGAILGIFRNEDLQNLTFNDETHDVFISLDVFEHIPYPDRALREIYRTLKFGGVMLSTFPVRNYQVEPVRRRVDYSPDGSEVHLVEPEIHGNGISGEGSIVTVDYGYDLHKLFSRWAPFDVRVYRFADTLHGILGDYTEVVVCRKEKLEEDDPRLSKMI
ncbi:class I SAM-dependent methyltransferase [Mycobacterium sp.]|uniref:class I SAM-dependent methyltransferase n=1 Tax=Mycobacterium sp. TaxID=1785 RepID=UPI003BABA38A